MEKYVKEIYMSPCFTSLMRIPMKGCLNYNNVNIKSLDCMDEFHIFARRIKFSCRTSHEFISPYIYIICMLINNTNMYNT